TYKLNEGHEYFRRCAACQAIQIQPTQYLGSTEALHIPDDAKQAPSCCSGRPHAPSSTPSPACPASHVAGESPTQRAAASCSGKTRELCSSWLQLGRAIVVYRTLP
ncbi:MAG: hypothetical protein ACN6OP_22615, partial [Pseudomonadales bacterium]